MCEHLIGRPYQLNGPSDTTDCIRLVCDALTSMGIANPGVQQDWYEKSPYAVERLLRKYTRRIDAPAYDGDIVLLSGQPIAFGVLWQQGILYINRLTMRVDWKPVHKLLILRSYRMKER